MAVTGHVFLSYVREDAADVDHLQQALEAAGIDVWRDTQSLWPGDDWRVKIRQAIEERALAFLACFSDRSESRVRTYQREELALASQQAELRRWDRPWLIPVRFSDCAIPPLPVGYNRRLNDHLQRADLFGPHREENTRLLVEAVRAILSASTEELEPNRGMARLPEHAIVHGGYRSIDWPITVPRQEVTVVRCGGVVTAICAVPVEGGRMLLASPGMGSVVLRDPVTGTLEGGFETGRALDAPRSLCVVQVGGRVLLATGDQAVQLWDPLTGQPRSEPLEGHVGQVLSLCRVPVGGRTLLASSSDDGTLRLWDPVGGRPVGDPLVGHTDLVRTVCTVPVGDRWLLASGSHDGTVRLWDPVTGQPRGEPLSPPGESHAIYDVCAIPVGDDILLAAACGDGMVRLWDPTNGRLLGEPLRGHAQMLVTCCVVPAGDRMLLASAGHGEHVRLWDPATGATAGVPLSGHTGWVTALCAVPAADQMLLASASVDGTMRVWGPAPPTPPEDLAARRAAAPPGPRDLMKELPEYSIARGEHAKVTWPEVLPGRDVHVFRGHKSTLQAVCAVPAGNEAVVASASLDGTVRLWDPATGLARGEPLTGHAGAVRALVAVSVRNRRLLASVGMDGTIRFWDPTTATATGEPVEVGDVFAMCGVPVDNRQVLLAAGNDEGTIRLWDPQTGEQVCQALVGHHDRVSSMCAFRVGSLVVFASASSDRTVRMWDPAAGRPWGPQLKRGRFKKSHDDRVHAMCAVPVGDRTMLASAGADEVIRIWDPATGQLTMEIPGVHADGVMALCAFPYGRRMLLATGGRDATLHLWDLATGTQQGGALLGHSEGVNDLCAVPVGDVMLLASSSHDGTVRLWGPADGQRSFNAVLDEAAGPETSGQSVFTRRMNAAIRMTDGRAHLQGDIGAWLVAYGKHMIDPGHSGVDRDEISPTVVALYNVWHEKPEDFVAKLEAVALPAGGWAAYGAHKLVHDILGSYLDGPGRQDEHYISIFKTGMTYMRSEGYSGWYLSSWEMSLLGELGML